MTACTEVAVCQLRNASSKHTLLLNDTFMRCVNIVTSQPGCLGVIWDVLAEDSKKLVWMAEWKTREDHSERFVGTDEHKELEAFFQTILDEDKPLISKDYYPFDPLPSTIASPCRPVLQLLAISASDLQKVELITEALQPITQQHQKRNRKFAIALALESETPKMMAIIAWESIAEHKSFKYTPHILECYGKAKQIWSNVDLFGHITPR